MSLLLIDCPHCSREISVPANVQTPCPQCRQMVIAEEPLLSAPKASALSAILRYQGGAGMFVALLLVLIPGVLAAVWFCAPYLPDLSSMNNLLQGGPLLLVALLVYFIPTLIASARHATNSGLIFLLNFLTGITIIGWVAAFIWAAVDKPAQA